MGNFKYLQNEIDSNGVATILLYAPIGGEDGINGAAFAKEIEDLQKVASKINVRINSQGGSVLEGYSIVSAIQNSTIPVHTYIDGLAASIAGVIALTGEKVFMKDFGTLMLHNPSGSNDQNLLDLVKNTLVTILSNNTAFTPESISEIMDKETFYTSSEAKTLKLVNEIIKSNKKVKIDIGNLSEMQNIYNKLINPTKKIKMNLITNQLGINEDATETVVVDAISALQADKEKLAKELEAEKLAKDELQKKIDAIETEKAEAKKVEIETMVNSFITAGKISNEDKEKTIKFAEFDFEGTKNMLEKIGTKTVANIVNAVGIVPTPAVVDEKANWTIRDYEKKDPKALMKIKNETPETYEKMFNAFYKK